MKSVKNALGKSKTNKLKGGSVLSNKLPPYLMVLPSIVLFLAFTIYPLIDMIAISFCDYNIFSDRKFVGLSNYNYIFNVQIDFWTSLKNTAVYTVSVLFFLILGALIFAVWLQKDTKINSFLQRAMFFPHLCASIAVAMIFSWLMDEQGLFNAVLEFFKLPGLSWLNSSDTAMISVVIVAVWKNVGYYALILLSSLKTIPKEIYEAAELDNTGKVRKFFHITIPLLSPQLFFLLITITIGSFKVFDSVKILTGGGPGKSTTVLVYYIYQYAQQYLKYGIGAAAGTVLIAILGIVTIFYFKFVGKKVYYQ